MNTRQLQYALALYEQRTFSAVADKLGITQPALSKQIHNLEEELGVKLFDRSTSPLGITPAGEHFLSQAQELLYKEDQLVRSLDDFKSGKKGVLCIGVTPFRSQYVLPRLVKSFRERYPDVQVVLHEAGSDLLRKETAEGRFDFSIVNLPVDESALDVTPIESDQLVLAVPKAMVSERLSGLDKIDLTDCGDIPFVTVGKNQEMRRLLDKSCALESFRPNVVVEVVGISTAFAMCLEGVGATLVPLQYVRHLGAEDKVAIFSLKRNIYPRQSAVIIKKGQFVSQYAKFAISLLEGGAV